MSELNEIKGLVEAINPTLVELRKEVDEVKNRDVIDEAKFSKMADDVTAKMQALQEKQAKLEAAMKRPDSAKDAPEFLSEHKAQFDSFMRDGIGLDGKGGGNVSIEVRAMSTNVQPDGGYLVRPELASFVVDRVFETSPMRQIARIETIGTKSLDVLVDDNEAGARWVAEGASGGQTDTPQLGQKEITAHKIEADPRTTTEQLQDSYLDVEAWLQTKVADKFARTENTAFILGNGVGKPRGVLDYADRDSATVYQRDRIRQLITLAAATVTADGFINQQNAIKEVYQARATWGMHRTTFGEALKLKGADNYFFSPVLLRDGQASIQLLGKPVVFMDDVPVVGAGNLSVLYGDFSVGYTIVDRVGLSVLRDPYTNKGFITFYTTKRTGGDVTNFEAFNIGRCAAS
jgi:HK97 family phage major capsid protein